MMNKLPEIKNLKLRLLGYYNEFEQTLEREKEAFEWTEILAHLLQKSFSEISRSTQNTSEISSAFQNGVFILRDETSHLYAYWPKRNIARFSNVQFNRDKLVKLPVEYKQWFVPGEVLQLRTRWNADLDVKSQKNQNDSIYAYVHSNSEGKQVLPINREEALRLSTSGNLVSSGKDYLAIETSTNQIVVISDTLCFRIFDSKDTGSSVASSSIDISSLDEISEEQLSPKGVVTKYDEGRQLGWIKTIEGEMLGLKGYTMLEDNIRVGSKVVFSVRNGKHKDGSSFPQACFVHLSEKINHVIQLASSLKKQNKIIQAREVALHILESCPNNSEAQTIFDSTMQDDVSDDDSKRFDNACALLDTPSQVDNALEIFNGLMQKGYRVSGCISRIAEGLLSLLIEKKMDDEDRLVLKQRLLDFVEENSSKLDELSSFNFRLKYYQKLGLDDRYYELINTALQEPGISNSRRGMLLYFKASKKVHNGEVEEGRKIALDSLRLNPFGNKSEMMIIPASYLYEQEPTIPIGLSSFVKCIMQMPVEKDVDERALLSKVLLTDKDSVDYYSNLESVLRYCKSNDILSEDQRLFFATEFLSLTAKRLYAEGKKTSAFYLWRNLFHILPGFGFYAQFQMAFAVSSILSLSAIKDNTLSIPNVWANTKTWKELLLEPYIITTEQWESLLYIVNDNKDIVRYIAEFINKNISLKLKFEEFVAIKNIEGKDVYNQILDTRKWTDQSGEIEVIKEMSSTLLSKKKDRFLFAQQMDINSYPFNALRKEDRTLFMSAKQDCFSLIPILNSTNSGYNIETKIATASKLKERILEIVEIDIIKQPSMFNVVFCNVMLDLYSYVTRFEEACYSESEPLITCKVDTYSIQRESELKFRFTMIFENAIRCSPASDVIVELRSNRVKACDTPIQRINSIDSGGIQNVSFTVELSSLKPSKTWSFAVWCDFMYGNAKKHIEFNPLQVRLDGQIQSFVRIKNPYKYGKKIAPTDPTFVGREEDIQKIYDYVMSPNCEGQQVIVYGQKRSGKSTLVEAISCRLQSDGKAWPVNLILVKPDRSHIYTEADFYYSILRSIYLCASANEGLDWVPCKKEELLKHDPYEVFADYIIDLKRKMQESSTWKDRRLVIIIDEFTSLYESIKSGTASETVLQHWRVIQEDARTCFSTIFVGHDITPAFFAEDFARNPTEIIKRYQLTYLADKDAIALITNPIADISKTSFDKEAVKRILYYTASSPAYLQLFMYRMVEYINDNSILVVTRDDVEIIIKRFVEKKYDEFDDISKFDNLINAGLASKYADIKDDEVESVLRAISSACDDNGTDWAGINEIQETLYDNTGDVMDVERIDVVLRNLEIRRVIESKNNKKSYSIKVKLFKEWLIRN